MPRGIISFIRRATTTNTMSKKLFMKPLKALVSPGMYLFTKITQYKRRRELSDEPPTPTDNDLSQLNTKIDKLLNKLNGKNAEVASTPDEECVICVSAKAVMQTYPCSHKVVCRRCFVRTIQVALSQRTLPLKCVVCRTKILRLKRTQNSHKSNLQSRSSSCSTSKQKYPEVTRSCSLEETWPNGASKYSRSLPGINGGSFKYRSSVNRSHSVVVCRKPTYSMRKCCRSCSLSSCSSMKTPKPRTSECSRSTNVEYRSTKRKIDENTSTTKVEPPERKKPTTSLSREELIQKFQRDFHEGQLSSRSSSTRKPQNKTSSCKRIDAIKPKLNARTELLHPEKKPCDILPENTSKCREKVVKTKENHVKNFKFLKFGKKDKLNGQNEKDTGACKKEKKNDMKMAKVK